MSITFSRRPMSTFFILMLSMVAPAMGGCATTPAVTTGSMTAQLNAVGCPGVQPDVPGYLALMERGFPRERAPWEAADLRKFSRAFKRLPGANLPRYCDPASGLLFAGLIHKGNTRIPDPSDIQDSLLEGSQKFILYGGIFSRYGKLMADGGYSTEVSHLMEMFLRMGGEYLFYMRNLIEGPVIPGSDPVRMRQGYEQSRNGLVYIIQGSIQVHGDEGFEEADSRRLFEVQKTLLPTLRSFLKPGEKARFRRIAGSVRRIYAHRSAAKRRRIVELFKLMY